MVRKALAALAVAVAVVGVAGLLPSAPVEATSHSAIRSFSAPWVLPGGRLEVTIAVSDYGPFGQVVETLPEGFSYEGSNLSEAAVAVEGQTVAFTLLGDERITYTVAAPSAEGSYSFSGVLLDANKDEQAVGGDSSIRVGPEPTPTPTPEPTPTPTPTPTPELLRPRRRLLLRPRRAYAHADAGANGHADAGANGHPHADGHADGHPHPGAGTHSHVGCPAAADGHGTRGRPANRVDRSDRRGGPLGGSCRRRRVRPQTSAVDDSPRKGRIRNRAAGVSRRSREQAQLSAARGPLVPVGQWQRKLRYSWKVGLNVAGTTTVRLSTDHGLPFVRCGGGA